MEWVYLILIIAFIIWTVQIIMVYRRQVDNIQKQIDAAQVNQQDTLKQAEDFESRAALLVEELAEIKAEAETLDKTEKGLEEEVNQYRAQQASRRPTRHRVQADEE